MGDTDYLANFRVAKGDKVDHGVLGQKWGIRNGRGKATADSSDTSKPSESETPSERYTRLLAHAKKHGSNTLDESDLKFVTARGDALSKVDRLNASNPNWAGKAAKQAVKQAAQKTMQVAVEHATKKYITTPLLNKVKG